VTYLHVTGSLCQFSLKSVHSVSKCHVHQFPNGRTNEWTGGEHNTSTCQSGRGMNRNAVHQLIGQLSLVILLL